MLLFGSLALCFLCFKDISVKFMQSACNAVFLLDAKLASVG